MLLEETEDCIRTWNVNDPHAQRITHRLVEMIALNSQLFSVVDNSGFVKLLKEMEPRYNIPSQKYCTKTILLRIVEGWSYNLWSGLTSLLTSGAQTRVVTVTVC